MSPITIKDVAKKAGVSIATVSYVVNNSRPVSPELADRVLEAIKEMGYRPDTIARSLKSKRTSTIGLIVPDNANPFFAEIAKGVEDEGFDAGFSVLLCNSNAMFERELAYIDLLLSKRVDGVIFAPTTLSTEPVNLLVQAKIPVVIFYREVHGLDVDTLRLDNEGAGYLAARHLIELGHRQIACIRPLSAETPSARRVDGFQRAMHAAGLDCPIDLLPQGNNLVSGGEAAARALLDSGRKFTAVFSTNDAMAIGAMRAFRDAGRCIPEDISVIGFDDITLARYAEPPLTTIAQPKQEAGALAFRRLLERIENNGVIGPRDFTLETQLIRRKSTASLHNGD